jgi:hypothetical protein
MIWTGGVDQMAEHLPSKHKALSLNPNTAKIANTKQTKDLQ